MREETIVNTFYHLYYVLFVFLGILYALLNHFQIQGIIWTTFLVIIWFIHFIKMLDSSSIYHLYTLITKLYSYNKIRELSHLENKPINRQFNQITDQDIYTSKIIQNRKILSIKTKNTNNKFTFGSEKNTTENNSEDNQSERSHSRGYNFRRRKSTLISQPNSETNDLSFDTSSFQNEEESIKEYNQRYAQFKNTLTQLKIKKQEYREKINQSQVIFLKTIKLYLVKNRKNIDDLIDIIQNNFKVKIKQNLTPNHTLKEVMEIQSFSERNQIKVSEEYCFIITLDEAIKQIFKLENQQQSLIWEPKKNIDKLKIYKDLLQLTFQRKQLDNYLGIHVKEMSCVNNFLRKNKISQIQQLYRQIVQSSTKSQNKKQHFYILKDNIFDRFELSDTLSILIIEILNQDNEIHEKSKNTRLRQNRPLSTNQESAYLVLKEKKINQKNKVKTEFDIVYKLRGKEEKTLNCMPGDENIWSLVVVYYELLKRHSTEF